MGRSRHAFQWSSTAFKPRAINSSSHWRDLPLWAIACLARIEPGQETALISNIEAEQWRLDFPGTTKSVTAHRNGRSEIGLGMMGDIVLTAFVRIERDGRPVEECILDAGRRGKNSAFERALAWACTQLGPVME